MAIRPLEVVDGLGYSLTSSPNSLMTTSFLYLLSPRELMRIAGSFPFLPQRLMVRGETRRSSATSLIVMRSGKSVSDIEGLVVVLSDIVCIVMTDIEKVNRV